MENKYTLVDVDDSRYVYVCRLCGELVMNIKLHNKYHAKEGF